MTAPLAGRGVAGGVMAMRVIKSQNHMHIQSALIRAETDTPLTFKCHQFHAVTSSPQTPLRAPCKNFELQFDSVFHF